MSATLTSALALAGEPTRKALYTTPHLHAPAVRVVCQRQPNAPATRPTLARAPVLIRPIPHYRGKAVHHLPPRQLTAPLQLGFRHVEQELGGFSNSFALCQQWEAAARHAIKNAAKYQDTPPEEPNPFNHPILLPFIQYFNGTTPGYTLTDLRLTALFQWELLHEGAVLASTVPESDGEGDMEWAGDEDEENHV